MANTLTNLKITRVALVDKGANQHAHIMLFKADSTGAVHSDKPLGDDDLEDYLKGVLSSEQRNSLPDSSFAAVYTDASGKKQRKLPYRHADGTIDNAHLAAARSRLDGADLPESVKASARHKLGVTKGVRSMKSTEMIKRMLGLFNEKDVAKRDAELAALAKAANDPPEPDEDDTKKAAHKPGDPNCTCADCVAKNDVSMGKRASAEVIELKKSLEAMEKRTKDAEDRAKAAEDLAKSERGTRKRAEMVTLLKSFRTIPLVLEAKTGETSDVDRYLKMQEADSDGFDRTIALLKAADAAQAESNLYKNVGSSGAAGGGDAWAQIEAKADQMVEKATTPLTREEAINKVMDANPKLVKQYREQQQ